MGNFLWILAVHLHNVVFWGLKMETFENGFKVQLTQSKNGDIQ